MQSSLHSGNLLEKNFDWTLFFTTKCVHKPDWPALMPRRSGLHTSLVCWHNSSRAYWEDVIECVYTDLYTVTLHMSKHKAWSSMWAWRHRMLNGFLSVIACVCESSAYHDVLCFVCVNGTCWSNILWSLGGIWEWYEVDWPSYITVYTDIFVCREVAYNFFFFNFT